MSGPGRPSLGDRSALSVRLDPTVLQALRASADQDLRSINAQMEAILREGLRRRGFLSVPGTAKQVKDVPRTATTDAGERG